MNIANTLVKIRTGEISIGADRLPAGDDFDEELPAGRYIDYRDGAIYTIGTQITLIAQKPCPTRESTRNVLTHARNWTGERKEAKRM